jgi:hypothetical protein
VQVPTSRLACPVHWFTIPKDLQDELWRAYRDDGQYSEQHLAAVEACVKFLDEKAAA